MPASFFRALALLVVVIPGVTVAQEASVLPPADALNVLQRIANAARQLNYWGTFVFQQGEIVETSRIAHSAEAGHEIERLETLDGPRREIVRKDDLVVIYNPETKQKIVDRRRVRRFFPQILPDQLLNVTDHYHVRRGDVERVADHDAQVLLLEPKDSLRYGHRFWVDLNSGLLLKAKMVGDRNHVVEQFAFTQVQIGGTVPRDLLAASFALPEVPPNPPAATAEAESSWEVRQAPAGFRKIVEVRRFRDSSGATTITHMVLTDGLTAISVFIEPARAGGEPDRQVRKGSVNIYTKVVEGHRVTVVGEAPAATVQTIASSVGPKSR